MAADLIVHNKISAPRMEPLLVRARKRPKPLLSSWRGTYPHWGTSTFRRSSKSPPFLELGYCKESMPLPIVANRFEKSHSG